MGFLDNLLAPFSTSSQDKASQDLIQGYKNAYGAATPLFESGRNAITSGVNTATGAWSPFLTAGQGAVGQLANATGANGPGGTSSAIANFTGGPSYQFNLDQMTQNLLRGQEATGQAASGATNNDILKLTSGYAGNQWQNYISNLRDLAGIGTNAAGGTSNAALTGAGLTNQSFTNQANAAYGTNVGEANAQAQADLAPLTAGKNIWGLGENLLQIGLGMPVSGGFLGGSGGGGGGGGGASTAPSFSNSPIGGMFNTLSPYLSGATPSYQNGGIYPMYAEGGDPEPGQPAVVGERGPEIFVPDRPGTIIPAEESQDVLSGARGLDINELARRYSPYQKERTPTDLKSMAASAVDPLHIPSTIAGTVAPEFAQRWQDTEAASPEGEFAGSLMPGGTLGLPARYLSMASRLARAYPKTAAGVGATGALAAGTAEAGDKPQGRPELSSDDAARLNTLDQQINQSDVDRAKYIKSKEYQNAPGSARNATLKTFSDKADAARTEQSNIRTRVAQQQEDYDQAGRPLSIAHPGAVAASRAGALGLSGLIGAVGGWKHLPFWPAPVLGGLAGTLGAVAPSAYDIMQPEGTAAKAQAEKNFSDPDFYRRVGIDTGVGAIEGAFTHGMGHVIGARSQRPPAGGAPPALPPAAPPSAPPPAPLAGPRTPLLRAPSNEESLLPSTQLPTRQPAGPRLYQEESTGRWRSTYQDARGRQRDHYISGPTAAPPAPGG